MTGSWYDQSVGCDTKQRGLTEGATGSYDAEHRDCRRRDVPISVTTMGDLVDGRAAVSHKTAVVFPDVRVTYPELAELTGRFARSLRTLGVEPGNKVAILMPNQLEFVAALIGIAKLGAVGVPINGRFKAHELAYVLDH